MAFLKFSRDKRGVENFFIVQPTTNRRGKVRPRVLYWFRSPPDVKVGRQPFDPSIRRALEAQNPDVNFDWRSIVETPIPSADADKWRERRRAEKAAKHAAAAEAAAEAAEAGETVNTTANADPESAAEEGEAEPAMIEAADGEAEPITASATVQDAPREPGGDPGRDPNRKRRRRRRGGVGRPSTGTGPAAGGGSTPALPASAATGLGTSGEPSGD